MTVSDSSPRPGYLSFAHQLGGVLVTVALLIALAPSAAQAATQTRSDASDAPNGAFGKADLRTVAWDVSGTAAQLTVGVDASSFGAGERAQIGVHVLIDIDDDGVADHEIVATRNADGLRVDLLLRSLDGTLSTSDCQDLAGGSTAAQATVTSTFADGIETFRFSLDPTLVPGGLAAFRWAAFAQAPPNTAGAGPWDVMPEAVNPDPAAANPGDRRCNSAQSGLRVRMNEGIAFPDVAMPPLDTTAPQTTVETTRINQGRRKAKFTFSSSEPISTFECKLDKKPFESCTSPKTYRQLKLGKHRVQVRATDKAANTDSTPAVETFKIKP